MLSTLLCLAALCAAPALAEDVALVPGAGTPPPALQPLLDRVVRDRLMTTATAGVQVVDLASGETVFSYSADRGLNPASTMKLVTAAAALRELGPSFTFATTLGSDAALGDDGTLAGDLLVRGGGDPHLVVERLWKLVRDLRLAGVERIAGDVVFDDSYLDTDHRLPGWGKRADIERGPAYFPMLGALSLNFNTVALVLRPGAEVGGPAHVALETPATGYVVVDHAVTTGSGRSRRAIQIDRQVGEDTLTFVVRGTLPAGGGPQRYYRAVHDPTAHFMAAFGDMLAEHDIVVAGRARRGAVSEEAPVLARHTSPPLAAILMDMNKYSNNFMAEQVLRTLGAEVEGEGSNAAGLRVIDAYLRGLGLDPASYRLVNGSGLSRDGFLTAGVLTAVLADMARDAAVGGEFTASLAIAGMDGTLAQRLSDERGRVRGKTGTIGGVHCLAGYIDAGDDHRYAFAFLFNDLPGSAASARRVHDRFARAVLQAGGTTVPAEVAGRPPVPTDGAEPQKRPE